MIDWSWLEQCEKWLYEFNVTLKDTLVEYDGPHLAIFHDEADKKFFGIFCDFDDDKFRWMLAPITGAELIAIYTGTVTLLDALNKKTIWFCDFDHSYHSINVWRAGFERIPSILLPKTGQVLPAFAQKPITEFIQLKENAAIIKLDGRRVAQNSLPFHELGRFLLQFQDYWDRLSRSLLIKMLPDSASSDPRAFASLSFCAATEGSVNIHFKLTSEIEKNKEFMLSAIDKLSSINETGVPQKISEELGVVGIRIANHMYSSMHSAGMDMLLVAEGKNLFIGSEKAGRLSRVIKQTQKVKSINLILRGHFCAGRSKKKTHSFEFVDALSGQSYKGKISPLVWRYTSIAVGESEYYEVEIETFEKTKDNQPIELDYVLVRADKMKRPMIVEDISE